MPTVPVADRTTAPPVSAPPDAGPGHERAALTPRGTAALRLSAFQDTWDQLTAADRAWFAAWLRDLLVDAVIEAPPA